MDKINKRNELIREEKETKLEKYEKDKTTLKIKENLWDIIIGTKNDFINSIKDIELRKIDLLNGNFYFKNGIMSFRMISAESNKYLGHINCNGYKIIKNPFINDMATTFLNLKKCGISNKLDWINKNWDWLKEYYKGHDKILILYIESWEI